MKSRATFKIIPQLKLEGGWLVGCSQNSLNVTVFYISKCKNFLSKVRYQPNVLVTVSQSENWHVALWSFVGIDRFTLSKTKLNVVCFSISPLLCQACLFFCLLFFFFFSLFLFFFFSSQLLFVSLSPVCWKNEGSSRPGASGAN